MTETLDRLINAVEEFRKHDPHGTLLTLQAFLMISIRGPITRGQMMRRLNISGPSMTNLLQRLSGNNPRYKPRKTQERMQLISMIPHPEHNGSKLAVLDVQGADVVTRIRSAFEPGDT